jgi:hypothetical protein
MTCQTELSTLFSAVTLSELKTQWLTCSVHYVVYKKELTYAYDVLDDLSDKIHKSQRVEKKVLDFIKNYFWCADYWNISYKYQVAMVR